MRPYSQSISPPRRRDRSTSRNKKFRDSTDHRYSYSRSRSVSRRPPSPPPLPSSKMSSTSRSSTRSPSSSRRYRRNLSSQNSRRHNIVESRCIGVFGLNVYTTQDKIREIFSKYGPIERIQVVIDAQTKRSRGFCFIYYKNLQDAKVAKNECCGLEVDSRRIRVDYSITQRPHTPTPGIYMGRGTGRQTREREYNDHRHREHAHSRSRRSPRTPSRTSSRYHRRSRSRSSFYTDRSRRRGGYDYRSRSRSRSRSHTPRRRARY